MAVSIIWPLSLPQAPGRNYSEDGGVQILRTPTDSGPAKQRHRGMRPSVLQVSFYMTEAQVSALETFVHDTVRGVKRFGFPHPRTGSQVEVRMIPGDDGQLYQLSFVENDLWTVGLRLEVLP